MTIEFELDSFTETLSPVLQGQIECRCGLKFSGPWLDIIDEFTKHSPIQRPEPKNITTISRIIWG